MLAPKSNLVLFEQTMPNVLDAHYYHNKKKRQVSSHPPLPPSPTLSLLSLWGYNTYRDESTFFSLFQEVDDKNILSGVQNVKIDDQNICIKHVSTL